MDLAELQSAVRAGKRFKYVFFWGHQPRRSDEVDAACFSNWFSSPFMLDGARYPTAEHYMMAGKARLFGDEEAFARILKAPSPGAAKRIGREVRNFSESTWVQQRSAIVEEGLVAKFRQNEALGAFLAGTKTRVLVEASPKDRIWGIGMAKDHEHVGSPLQWNGLNLLGFALMNARARL